MNRRATYACTLGPIVSGCLETGDTGSLFGYLAEQSNLPGPRGNLEMAAALADVAADRLPGDAEALWQLAEEMTAIDATQAPTGDPLEMVPFAGTLVLGALGAGSPAHLDNALHALRSISRDPRWRLHEAVAMALQHLLSTPARPRTLAALETWLVASDPLPARAVAAGVAEPWLLDDAALGEQAVALHRRILGLVASEPDRRSDAFRSLRQGLAYTLSVVVAATPECGFSLLEELAHSTDRDVRWILSRNLTHDRLSVRYAAEVARIVALQDVHQ